MKNPKYRGRAPKPTPKEILEMGALDMEFYGKQWFPQTFRQRSAPMHLDMWRRLEDPRNRYIAFKVARGFAKTSLIRVYMSKRIAYADSRVLLPVGASQEHSIRTVRWLKRQIQNETAWARFFQLTPGDKWTDEWIEIKHAVAGWAITVLSYGVDGKVRGVNLDDWRPDFIVVDDADDDERASTEEQRQKLNNRVMGAIRRSLASPVDAPNAKMAVAQTAIEQGDLIDSIEKDANWETVTYSCFARGKKEESAWPELYPTEFLRKEKQSYIDRGQLHIWLREMECRVVSPETSSFRREWLQEYDSALPPEGMTTYLWIDPVPPPSKAQEKKNLKTKDFEALAVVGRKGSKVYLLEYLENRGHDPEWTLKAFWELVARRRVRMAGVETVAYQRTLKWLIEKSMRSRGKYVQMWEPEKEDRRAKGYRIVDSLSGICSQGMFYVDPKRHGRFIEQFTLHPGTEFDDVLEAVANATKMAQEDLSWMDDDDDYIEGGRMADLPQMRYAP